MDMKYDDMLKLQQGGARKRPSHVEEDLQAACVRWFSLQYPKMADLLVHPANGGKRNAREAARFKLLGVRPGVPDLLLLKANRFYPFMGIEMKSESGRQTELQKQYQELMESEGAKYVVCRSLEQFIEIVKNYLSYV